MPYLLDTCALSEFVAPDPDLKAVERLVHLPRNEIYLCAITIGELEQGITEMQPCDRKAFLRKWLDEHVLMLYAERTFPDDAGEGFPHCRHGDGPRVDGGDAQ